ncbi:transient receptor potential cation channel subfamily A member 1-like [Ruditapes philippinarum]|uniref:transient receptor potential cation channel subfamily A member 1-like n=1 Tax=Ruditapes philippinarum TaxID=129788 RepID=UPI00295A9352|nr:transient receptor potential cation channel subfamily A member 1-like [Ruditapes philippinarum]
MLGILRQFEWIGIYVVLLHRIVTIFTKFFFVFSLLIIAFAISFHCLFQNQEQFSTFGLSLVKTTSMMIGEIDFGATFFEANVNFEMISFVFYYIFVLLMTIVVINLLVGLAVANIQEFERNAGLTNRRMQVS